MAHDYLATLRERVLIYDGATGTSVQARNLTADDFGGRELEGCNEMLVLSRPDVVTDIHRSFFEAGADVVETDTFGGSRTKLDEYGLGARTHEINRRAAELARAAADREAAKRGRPCFVAGSIGPTGFLPSTTDPTLSNVTFEQLVEIFDEQGSALVEGGADVLLVETGQDILEVRAAIAGIRRAFARGVRRVPIQAQISLDTSGRMLLGTDVAAAIVILEHAGADAIGLNCSTGPDYMRVPIRTMAELASVPLTVIPNAGIPINVTLLFDSAQHLAAAEAWMEGTERRIADGLPPDVPSVASLFMSRWDVKANPAVPAELKDKLGLAIGGRAYRAYLELLASPRMQRLMNAGARPQRLLWASTGTKDPKAPDTLYVDALAAPFTVNTMPEGTLKAVADHGQVGAAMATDGGDSASVLAAFTKAGTDVDALAAKLQDEGAAAFVKSWNELIGRLAGKRAQIRKAS